jgi:hypothetical protein
MNLLFKKGVGRTTNDAGATENKINILTPRDNDILLVFGLVVTAHPYSKAIRIILLYMELLSMRNAW